MSKRQSATPSAKTPGRLRSASLKPWSWPTATLVATLRRGPRAMDTVDLPGLCSWPLKRYPYIVFYVGRDDHIDVWRVLHGLRDFPVWLREEGGAPN